MRNFTPQTESQLIKDFGTEPMILIGVDWVQDGNVTFYADRAISGQPVVGKILDISILDNVFVLSDNSESKEISITLDDTDGILKGIINNNDIHNRAVSVYHWDASTPVADRALLFQGVINSPIIWDEGDRTLKFTVLNKLEDAEYGFSLDESRRISSQPLDLQGKAWPLCFGTPINVPALRLTNVVEGKLEVGVGILDFTLVPKYNYIINCAKCLQCRTGSTFDPVTLLSAADFSPCSGCNRRVCVEQRKLELQISQQINLQFANLTISGADRFPQGVVITLEIDGALFNGFFDGTSLLPSSNFVVNWRQHAKFDEIGSVSATSVTDTINAEVNALIDTNCGPTTRDLVVLANLCDGIPLNPNDLPANDKKAVDDFWRVFNAWPSGGFQFIDPGAGVKLASGADVTYVCNLVPSTTILRVMAKKNVGRATRLVDVPATLWSTRTTDFGSYNTTEIVFPKLLSTVDSEWEDDIFVTLVSSVGPDITEVLEHLINTYTSFTIDTSSFAAVKVKLTGWEANFALLDRGNILNLLRDIAFQARCAIYIRNDVIFLQFLASRPTIDDLILESDVENNSLSLGHTDTEELVTKFVARWATDYAAKEQIKTILRFNVVRYGLKEQEFDFFIYNKEEMVKQAALFWLIRKSQIWRRVRFTTPIHKLQLETFDNVEVRFTDFSSIDILAQIEKASYNSADYSINFDCWTPVRSGEQTEYDFAFIEDVSVDTIYPLLEDLDSGAFDTTTPGALVIAPIDATKQPHPLSSNDECDATLVEITWPSLARDQGCFNVASIDLGDEDDKASETGDEPTAAPTNCETDPSVKESSSTTLAEDGGNNIVSGNLISQATSTVSQFAFNAGTQDCDTPHDEESKSLEEHGDPEDALGTEDPDNDFDPCNFPVCETPSPCDLEPATMTCSASVNVGSKFFGVKIGGKAVATGLRLDQYCFNSDTAAQAFGLKIFALFEAQGTAGLGDIQIASVGIILSGGQPPCNDITNPRTDQALISFRQYGDLTSLTLPSPIPLCVTDDAAGQADPCVAPEYLS